MTQNLSQKLNTAVFWGNESEIKNLIKEGADVNAYFNGDLPLCIAVLAHRPSVVKLLVQHNAQALKRDRNGCNALDYIPGPSYGVKIALLHELLKAKDCREAIKSFPRKVVQASVNGVQNQKNHVKE